MANHTFKGRCKIYRKQGRETGNFQVEKKSPPREFFQQEKYPPRDFFHQEKCPPRDFFHQEKYLPRDFSHREKYPVILQINFKNYQISEASHIHH